MRLETVAEYVARGGKITKVPEGARGLPWDEEVQLSALVAQVALTVRSKYAMMKGGREDYQQEE